MKKPRLARVGAFFVVRVMPSRPQTAPTGMCTIHVGAASGREGVDAVLDQNKSIGADSSAGSGLPGALPLPNSLLEGGVSSLLNSSK